MQNFLYTKLIPIQGISQIGRMSDTQQNVILWNLNPELGTKSETKNWNVLFRFLLTNIQRALECDFAANSNGIPDYRAGHRGEEE